MKVSRKAWPNLREKNSGRQETSTKLYYCCLSSRGRVGLTKLVSGTALTAWVTHAPQPLPSSATFVIREKYSSSSKYNFM